MLVPVQMVSNVRAWLLLGHQDMHMHLQPQVVCSWLLLEYRALQVHVSGLEVPYLSSLGRIIVQVRLPIRIRLQ